MAPRFSMPPAAVRARCAFALALILLIVLAALSTPELQQVLAPRRLYPVYRVATSEKLAALTFDISWGTRTPAPVVAILKAHGVRSTFFLSGPWVMNQADLARLIRDAGHEIASHGYQHSNYTGFAPAELVRQVGLAQAAIHDTLGVTPRLIRTPNGDYDTNVIATLREQCGLQVIQWSVDSLDWLNPGADQIISRVLAGVHPGAVILCHASDSSRQIVAALPALLDGLKARGYRLVTVSELLKAASATPQGPVEPGTFLGSTQEKSTPAPYTPRKR